MLLLDYVKALEGREKTSRRQEIVAALGSMGITPVFQTSAFLNVKNITVTFRQAQAKKTLLFSAHYDARGKSPGANDNASGVAVLLGLCRELRESDAPVRIVFFDREEAWFRTPFLKLGLLGSLYYVSRNYLGDIAAIYNLEFCGFGETLVLWPLRRNEHELASVQRVEQAAVELNLPIQKTSIPGLLMSSDHLSFRLRGVREALTLSLLPAHVIPELNRLANSLSIRRLLKGERPALPEPLSFIHTSQDVSSRLNEASLNLMLTLLLKLVRDFTKS